MSRYDWPDAHGADAEGDGGDDSAGRARFNRQWRQGLGVRHEEALQASRALRATTPVLAPRAVANSASWLWQPLGPLALIKGQAEGEPRVSGRVNAISVHRDGQRAYAASANGGVWYTKDGGANWVSVAGLAATNTAGINRPAQRNACGAIYVEFGANEGEDTVFLGTGEVTHEMAGEPGDSEGGVGILVADWPLKSGASDPWSREATNLVNDGVYRIVRQPGGTTTIAATRSGLYQRPAMPDVDDAWPRPDAAPFDDVNVACTDALWTAANGTSPARLWVWVSAGGQAGLWVRDDGEDRFHRVDVAGASAYRYPVGYGVLAAPEPATQVWLLADRGGTSPALFRISNPAGGAGRPQALAVNNVPNVLRDAGDYAIALAAHPTQPDTVVLGGNYWGDPHDAAEVTMVTSPDGIVRGYDASIITATVAADPAHAGQLTFGITTPPFTMVGIGVHPDMHALAFSNAGATLWACCDGGIFRSDRPTRPAGFYARNQGLSISESNYVTCHPKCEGQLIAGLQDNGIVTRRSSGVWEVTVKGDGGGVAFDAETPVRWLGQYIQGKWNMRGGGGGRGPLMRGRIVSDENESSAFYSAAASIANVRHAPPAADVRFGQTIVGTHRLWYTEDHGVNWFTLPTGSDPLPATVVPVTATDPDVVHDERQDTLGAGVIVCRWQDPDVAWALTPNAVYRFTRTNNAVRPGTWHRDKLLKKGVKNKRDATSAEGPVRKSPHWTEIQTNWIPPAGAQPGVGALYLGTVGHPDDTDVDTLWWFDGVGTWFPTALRAAVPAPVISVAVDPDHPDQVWAGTTVGVWWGTRTRVGTDAPSWHWVQRVNGLPEAAVEDLGIFSDNGLKLLRAAIAARGIWELRLDTENVPMQTYLRAHDDDLRHRSPTSMVAPDGTSTRSWHGSPDVRPRAAPVAVAAPASLPWQGPIGLFEPLRRFQAALRSSTGDPRVAPTGTWDAYFSEVLRDLGASTVPVAAAPPLPAYDKVQLDAAFWNTHMTGAHATAEAWGAGPPTEADLHEYTAVDAEGNPTSASARLRAGPMRVDVVVHHRGREARPGEQVRVTLLKWIDASVPRLSSTDSTTWAPNPVPWNAAVSTMMNNADGSVPAPLTDGWDYVGGTNATRRVTLDGQVLDCLNAGIATFDLDLTGVAAGTVVLLVAVIRVGDADAANDIALPAQALRDLVVNLRNVAVRSGRVG